MLQLIDRILTDVGLEKEFGCDKNPLFELKSIDEIKKLIVTEALV